MTKMNKLLAVFILLLSSSLFAQKSDFVAKSFKAAAPLYDNLLAKTKGNFIDYPHSLYPDGSLKHLQIDE